MLLRLIFSFLLIFTALSEAKPPALTPKDTRIKIQEILKAHASYQVLSEEIIKRAFIHYLEELDPIKTYLLEDEVIKWTSPSKELLQKTLENIAKDDFSTFYELHHVFVHTLERRNKIEEDIVQEKLLSHVTASELKDLPFAKDDLQLRERLLKIRSLQLETGDKLTESEKKQFLQKLSKRRINREDELKAKNAEERKQVSLAYVLKSISSSLDSQTAYFTPAEASQFMIQVQQKLYGIGAQLRDDLNGLTIIRMLEGGPAALSKKLKIGDKIIAVNKESIVGLDISEAVEMIRGQQGTPVFLTLVRQTTDSSLEAKQESTFDIELIRREVVLTETRLETQTQPFGDGCIGIFHLFSFYQDHQNSSASDLYEAIADLKKNHNLRGVILDLRNNSGGLLSQAVAVSGLFLSKGVVVSVKDNAETIQHLRNLDGKKIWDGPLLVLTNRASASASEIVAQTLQDYGRALVVGDPETFGKGTFQTFTLEAANYGKVNPKGEFKVTRGRYYTVSGKSPQLVGVKADISVPGILSELEVGEKYAKFPLEADQINPSFIDDLADVSGLHKVQLQRIYKTEAQPILSSYKSYLQTLKTNSEKRIASNKKYQQFLQEVAKKDQPSESIEIFEQNDLQLTEAIHILLDLLFLSKAP